MTNSSDPSCQLQVGYSKGPAHDCVKIDAMQPRIVFMGSPEFALPTLRALNDHYPVVGVVTQPDRPAGRGRALTPPPVKTLASSLSLPVIQPHRLKEPQAMQQLREWKPDLIVVAAFGQILKPEVLDIAPLRLHQRTCFTAAPLAGCCTDPGRHPARR